VRSGYMDLRAHGGGELSELEFENGSKDRDMMKVKSLHIRKDGSKGKSTNLSSIKRVLIITWLLMP
jgi:hypothetical protein